MLFAVWLLELDGFVDVYAGKIGDEFTDHHTLANLMNLESILDRSRGIAHDNDVSRELTALLDKTRALINTFSDDEYRAVAEGQVSRTKRLAGLS